METDYFFSTPTQPPIGDFMASFDHDQLDFMLFNGGVSGGLIDGDPYHDAAAHLPQFSDHDHVLLMNTQNIDYPLFSIDQVVNKAAAHDHDQEYYDDDDNQNNESIEQFSTPPPAATKDRSKTLVAERKRRVRMKEKLYELRSLVPNITKMDKASIIDDAVAYVNNLQSQTKKLREEIGMLEKNSSSSSSSGSWKKLEDQTHSPKKICSIPVANYPPSSFSSKKTICSIEKETKVAEKKINHRIIIDLNAHEVGERKFYVKVEGILAGDVGLTSSLYSAMESLSCFHLESSNFSLISHGFELKLAFHVTGGSEGMDASSMRLWVMGALLKEGFKFSKAEAPY